MAFHYFHGSDRCIRKFYPYPTYFTRERAVAQAHAYSKGRSVETRTGPYLIEVRLRFTNPRILSRTELLHHLDLEDESDLHTAGWELVDGLASQMRAHGFDALWLKGVRDEIGYGSHRQICHSDQFIVWNPALIEYHQITDLSPLSTA